jgi:hypothetical protein
VHEENERRGTIGLIALRDIEIKQIFGMLFQQFRMAEMLRGDEARLDRLVLATAKSTQYGLNVAAVLGELCGKCCTLGIVVTGKVLAAEFDRFRLVDVLCARGLGTTANA